MNKVKNTTSENVCSSIASIYSELLSKRKQEKEAKQEKKRLEEEQRELEKEAKEKEKDEGVKLSKKERREAEFENWKEIIIGLTGDDLEYSSEKKPKKKKYRTWIDDENDNSVITVKPKKVKKKNYNKEFAPELQMLKNIVADQNKFTADLQKRFNTMVGPATKDAMPPNKTMVELASVINAGRSNSLGMLNAIGNMKKVIAELYFKQLKEEGANAGAMGSGDMALMGSSIASSLFADNIVLPSSNTGNYYASTTQPSDSTTQTVTYQGDINSSNPTATAMPVSTIPVAAPMEPRVQEFDPSSWDGPENLKINASVQFETIPHSIVVEKNQSANTMRFKAVRDDTGEELVGCPVPTYDVRNLKVNEKDLIAKGQFDETYKVEII